MYHTYNQYKYIVFTIHIPIQLNMNNENIDQNESFFSISFDLFKILLYLKEFVYETV